MLERHRFSLLLRRSIFCCVLLVTLDASAQNRAAAYTAAGGAGRWTPLAEATQQRVESPSVVIDGKLYVFGGFYNDQIQITNTVEVYDPSTDAWSARASMPIPVTHVGFAQDGERVWFVGGFEGDHPGPAVNVVQIYDAASDTWSQGPPLPHPRGSGTLARLGRTLHYVGGLMPDRDTDVGEHYVLDLDHPGRGWTEAAPLPDPRNHLSSAVVGGRLYAIGGQQHHRDRVFDAAVHVYDFTTDTWRSVAGLPAARSHFESSTIAVDGKILILGGVAGTKDAKPAVDHVTEYDPETDTWRALEPMPESLLGPVAKVIGDRLIVSHGGLDRSYYPQRTAWSRPFDRRPDRLGFWPSSIDVEASPDGSAQREALVWTLSGRTDVSFDVAGAPSWVHVDRGSATADPAGAPVSVRVDAGGLEPGTYTATIRASAAGYDAVDLPVTLTVGGASPLYFQEEAGTVVMEAEHFAAQNSRGDHAWVPRSVAGSNGSAVQASPNNGTNINKNYSAASPELRFRIAFETAGVYYVWARVQAASNEDDSFHAGLDGQPVSSASRITSSEYGAWTWTNETLDGPRATLTVAEAGGHDVSVWMREDGLMLDRLVLTTDAGFRPTGDGPGESARGALSVSTEADDMPPDDALLLYNYPNPFSETTAIGYRLAATGDVRLSVYDVRGRRIAVPVQERQSAGEHVVTFDGAGLADGIYFYELTVDGRHQGRSMILRK